MARERRLHPWSRDEFMDAARRHGGPELVEAHEKLLAAVVHPLEARFDGRGPAEASYNIYAADLSQELLRVRAKGKFQACIQHPASLSQPKRAIAFREGLSAWIRDDAEGFPWLSKDVAEIDVAELVRVLMSVTNLPPG